MASVESVATDGNSQVIALKLQLPCVCVCVKYKNSVCTSECAFIPNCECCIGK
jgi:hypothetical protein